MVVGIDNINDYYDVELKYARLSETGISREEIIRLETHPELFSESAAYHLFQSSKYPNYRFAKIDITDNGQLSKLFANEKFDVVCNLAAQAGVRYSIENPACLYRE